VRRVACIDGEDDDRSISFNDPLTGMSIEVFDIEARAPFLDGIHLVALYLEVILDDVEANRET